MMKICTLRNDPVCWVTQKIALTASRAGCRVENRITLLNLIYMMRILPWNLRKKVVEQLAYIREWGGQLVTSVPVLKVG